jgi:hypothetical protein
MKTAAATELVNQVQPHRYSLGKIARRIASFLGRSLILVLSLLLCLPVILLPSATLVPAWIWIPLVLADVSLLIMQFRLVPVWRGLSASLLGVIIVSVIAVVASQYFATTPPITDASGQPIPGSIATLEKVN